MSDTTPPASLLALCLLGDSPEEWQTVGELCDRIEERTGERPDYSTLRDALCRLAAVDRVRRRKQVHDGLEIVQYRAHN